MANGLAPNIPIAHICRFGWEIRRTRQTVGIGALRRATARPSTRSGVSESLLADAMTAARACAKPTIRTTTRPSCVTLTAIAWKLSATTGPATRSGRSTVHVLRILRVRRDALALLLRLCRRRCGGGRLRRRGAGGFLRRRRADPALMRWLQDGLLHRPLDAALRRRRRCPRCYRWMRRARRRRGRRTLRC